VGYIPVIEKKNVSFCRLGFDSSHGFRCHTPKKAIGFKTATGRLGCGTLTFSNLITHLPPFLKAASCTI
jgi:hypothetical protein